MSKFSVFCFLLISISCFSQDSLNMYRAGQWNPPGMPSSGGNAYNDVWGYTAPTGEEYAILGNRDSILIIDVSVCDNPQRVYGFDGGGSTTWRDFKTYGSYLYGVCDNCIEGLHIFDLSALPGGNVTHELSTTSFFFQAHNIYIEEDSARLYAVGVPGATDLTILDLSVTPDNPTLLADVNFNTITGTNNNYYIHDIYVRRDTAYASHGNLGFYIWDMNNLNNITQLGDMNTGGYNHSSWTTDDAAYAYYAEEVPQGLPLGIIDLANMHSTLNNIDTIKTFVDPAPSTTIGIPTPHNPYVHEDTLYISYYEDGIKAYDVTSPTNPVLVGYYDTYSDNGATYSGYNGCWGIYPFLDSGCLLASDRKYGLNTIKYGTPPPPLPPCDSTNAYLTGNLPQLLGLKAFDTIMIDARLPLNSIISLEAGNSIEIETGFNTGTISAEFEAKIGPCNNNVTIKPEEEEIEIYKKN